MVPDRDLDFLGQLPNAQGLRGELGVGEAYDFALTLHHAAVG